MDDNMATKARNELKRFIKEEAQNEESQSDNLGREDPIVVAEEDTGDESEDFLLPGLKMTSKSVVGRTKDNSNINEIEDKLNKDIKKYEESAAHVVDKAKAIAKASAVKKREKLRNEGKHNDAGLVKPKLRTVDPLDYWLKQEKLSDWLSILPGLAQDIMCIPASSVPSE